MNNKKLFYLHSQLINPPKVWSGIVTTTQKILARFNNRQVIRPLEAKAYLVLATMHWLIAHSYSRATLFIDDYVLYRRLTKLLLRPSEKGYSVELEFRLTQRGKMPWPAYLWSACQLITQHNLKLTFNYLKPLQNPAYLITKSLKVCPKCQRLKRITPPKRNCPVCWKVSRAKQYERWKAWQELKKG